MDEDCTATLSFKAKALSRVKCDDTVLQVQSQDDDCQVQVSLTCGDVRLEMTSLMDVLYSDARSVRYRKIRSSSADHLSISTNEVDAVTAKGLERYDIISSQQLNFHMRPTEDIEQMRVEILLVKPKESDYDTSNACMMIIRSALKFTDLISEDSPSRLRRIDLFKGLATIPCPPSPRNHRNLVSSIYSIFLLLALALSMTIWVAYFDSSFFSLALIISIMWFLISMISIPSNDAFSGNVFFVNGWSVWSFCGVVKQGNTVPPYGLPSAFVRGFHSGSRALDINLRSSGLFTWLGLRPKAFKDYIASDMFTVLANTSTKMGITMGFISQREQFGYISTDRDYRAVNVYCDLDGVHVSGGSTVVTDWFAIHLQPNLDEDFQAMYINLSGFYNSADKLINKAYTPVGWCSWYHFFEKINEKVLYQNIEDMKEIDRKYKLAETLLFQIDDGYQDSWGDWLSLSKSKFPSQSMPALVQAIKEAGMIPGVWAAPFACDKHSDLAKKHPHWILRRKGSSVPANSGNCGKWFYGLDVTHPEVQNFIRSTIEVLIREWGFQYLKLDFLYAAALEHCRQTYHNPYLTRAQAVQVGLNVISGIPGIERIFILGCGAPVGSVIGKVHANRVSADAGLGWLPEAPLPSWDRWNLPCARNMVRNSICRLGMHRRWWINDPDCILLRLSTHFNDDEIRGIATVKAMSGGSIIISDHLPAVSKDRMRIVRSILPTISTSAVPLDLLDREMPEIVKMMLEPSWVLLALCNWEDNRAKKHKVDLRQIFDAQTLCSLNTTTNIILAYEFWRSEWRMLSTKECESWCMEIPLDIPVHSAVMLSLRPMLDPRLPCYVGSNLHFSCGAELDLFHFESGKGTSKLKMTFKEAFLKGDDWNGEIFVYIPLKLKNDLDASLHGLQAHGFDVSVSLQCCVAGEVEALGCVVKVHLGHNLGSSMLGSGSGLHVHLVWTCE